MKDPIYTAKTDGCRLLENGIFDGYSYVIATMGSHPCAYVEIPEWHPFSQLRPDTLERRIHCHGRTDLHRTSLSTCSGYPQHWPLDWLGLRAYR